MRPDSTEPAVVVEPLHQPDNNDNKNDSKNNLIQLCQLCISYNDYLLVKTQTTTKHKDLKITTKPSTRPSLIKQTIRKKAFIDASLHFLR